VWEFESAGVLRKWARRCICSVLLDLVSEKMASLRAEAFVGGERTNREMVDHCASALDAMKGQMPGREN
jgi:hypothetical protein